MTVWIKHWDQIRDAFSPDEKLELTGAIIGRVFCPQAYVIDPDKVSKPLLKKLHDEIAKVRPTVVKKK